MSLKPAVIIVLIGLAISGCNSKRIAELEAQNDSLQNELKARGFMSQGMREVNSLLDSIDINRNLLTEELTNISTVEDLKTRLQGVNEYVKRSEKKIATIEAQLRSSRNEAFAYTMMVDALKGEVVIRDGEVIHLTSAVSEYQNANQNLLDSLRFHEGKVNDMHFSISEKQKQLAALESKVHSLENDFRLTEAEVYYAKARLLEEAARRTRLAPQKKKQTLTEALELYRKAYSLGKNEAKVNIQLLEGNVSASLQSAHPDQTTLNE
jgi:chromosome segregation ATPase